MPYLDVLATIHTPVTADGELIKNSFGVTIATMTYRNSFATAAMCDLINMGAVVAKERNDAHDAQEKRLREALNRRSK